nr:MAG TPA: hypothetical protein [Caudoviricetes sp.]
MWWVHTFLVVNDLCCNIALEKYDYRLRSA